ncbi:tip120-family protein [Cryptococcus deuterogattii LA55]|nr:tip120-family protein [Cryptococcus deuterogattii LA55]KIR75075.1 tip120-family protein [Cryptococcus deuterogattii CA1014]KIR92744.1 tip120-family protein [Cryptococcus deuterogattii CBS 10090]KIR98066.1 tip120-family protein [Cryptococcus deuterogattii 2001/935-1]
MSRVTAVPLSSQLPGLLEKMRSIDPDYRIMALVDLNKELTRTLSFQPSSTRRPDPHYTDDYTESQLVEMVLKLLADSNGEVKSAAVACISLMVKKPRPSSLSKIINSLLEDVSSDNDERRDTSCLALKNVVLEMPSESQQVLSDIERIVTRVFKLFTNEIHPQIASELLQILTDLFIRFSLNVASSATIQSTALSSLTQILDNARPAIRKRAIPTLSSLIATSPKLFNEDLEKEIVSGVSQGGESSRIWMGTVASLARGKSVGSIGKLVNEGKLAELILSQTKNEEDVETVEAALTALEALVLRCPSEMFPHVSAITQRSLMLVKYDPMMMKTNTATPSKPISDLLYGVGHAKYPLHSYSDEDDDSWKIRRSSAKLLRALISTRPDLLSELYNSATPVLISRFSEREESVRLEVLAAFEVLLKQTATSRSADLATGGRNKRKRSEGMDEDYVSDDGPISSLQSYLPQLSKAILTQLSSKSVPTRQQSFNLLRQAATALGGGLDDSADPICAAAVSALRTIDSATSSSLAIATLSFLAVFFDTHSARTFASHLGDLVPAIMRCMKDKLQRISFEAFDTASALIKSLRPAGSSASVSGDLSIPIQEVFAATTEVLGDNSVDGDVREKALATLGSILVQSGDLFASSFSTSLPLITNRLGSESTASTAIVVIGQLAASAQCKGPEFEGWLLQILPEVVVALRRTKRGTSKNAEFTCLLSIIERVGKALPVDLAEGLIIELTPVIDTPMALQAIALVLTHQPSARPAADAQLYPKILTTLKTSLNPHLVDALAEFFTAYAASLNSPERAVKLVQELSNNLGSGKEDSLPDATSGGTAAWGTTAKCVGGVIKGEIASASETLTLFENVVKGKKVKETDAYLALLCIGEIGRIVDLSTKTDLFEIILSFFKHDSEEVRSAAAFAAGNLAVGAPAVYVPAIITKISSAKDESERLLLLHAIKEVILHSPSSELESLADTLWAPLFSATDATSASKANSTGDDGIRNVIAACIGKLTTTVPAKFLPQLQHLLHSSPSNRATVAAAVRYTFIDTSNGYDELIAPILVEFLSLMKDENLIVRRLSLASLNAALQNKPHLIVDKLDILQPLLYQETYVKKELQREVTMGPWKVIEDDGLENRKTAYETMYTLLGTCFSKIDLPTFTARVLVSLSDVNEVKILGLMLLLRLGQVSPESVIPRLDEVVESLKGMMKDVEVKEDTVKQDLERKAEMQRSTLRTVVPLYKSSTPQQAPAFHAFVENLLSNEKWKEFKDYQA